MKVKRSSWSQSNQRMQKVRTTADGWADSTSLCSIVNVTEAALLGLRPRLPLFMFSSDLMTVIFCYHLRLPCSLQVLAALFLASAFSCRDTAGTAHTRKGSKNELPEKKKKSVSGSAKCNVMQMWIFYFPCCGSQRRVFDHLSTSALLWPWAFFQLSQNICLVLWYFESLLQSKRLWSGPSKSTFK